MSYLKLLNMKEIILRCLMIIGMLFVTNFISAQEVITHTVERGETLESIAQKYHVTKSDIKKNNPYVEDAFYVGLKLYIPTSPSEKIEDNNYQRSDIISQETTPSYREDNSYNKQTLNTYPYNNGNSNSISTFDPLEQDGGLDIQYHAIDNGWGIGLDYVVKYFLFGYEYYFGKKNDAINSNMGFEILVGGNFRYHIIKNFYLEGRIFGGYYQWDISYKKGKGYDIEDTKTREAFFGVSPRAGIQFGKVAISAGYRWDWIKMKFKKEYCFDRFTVGLTITF